jgi:signal peptidase II
MIAVLIVFADQITKFFINSGINLGQSIPLINNIIHITLVHNRGAGFGILQGQRVFFIIFSIVILGAIIYSWKKIPKNAGIPLGLILGGIVGNLIDRVVLGYVIDFIDFRIWPVFNVADSAVTIGVIWLIIYLWKT